MTLTADELRVIDGQDAKSISVTCRHRKTSKPTRLLSTKPGLPLNPRKITSSRSMSIAEPTLVERSVYRIRPRFVHVGLGRAAPVIHAQAESGLQYDTTPERYALASRKHAEKGHLIYSGPFLRQSTLAARAKYLVPDLSIMTFMKPQLSFAMRRRL